MWCWLVKHPHTEYEKIVRAKILTYIRLFTHKYILEKVTDLLNMLCTLLECGINSNEYSSLAITKHLRRLTRKNPILIKEISPVTFCVMHEPWLYKMEEHELGPSVCIILYWFLLISGFEPSTYQGAEDL